ncbi:MAG TPA: vanadium-dependent haloperoxidase [Pyrinomonadaceae bacterium]|nr:vanadium-dependent haloperoxidase [Pyrinomonadaceae bacterium]
MLRKSLSKQAARARLMSILFAFIFIALPSSVSADKVTDWNEIGAQAVLNTGRAGAVGTIDLAYMHIAMYDAVNAIEPGYSVFAASPSNVPPGASSEAATVEAAYRVLIAILPSQAAYINQQYAISIASIPNSQSKTDGMAVGAEVAALFLASRVGDGRNANVTYTPGTGPGAWIPTSPTPPAAPWLRLMRPFGIESASQFRPDPPPSLDSAEWAEEYNEVKRLGSINSAHRTPEQTTLARVFLDPGVTQLAKTFRQLATNQGLSLRDNARLFAYLYVAQGDATIAGFNAKYHYGFWRPITAIRNGDTDGNPDTEADPSWMPLSTTPNHPEYLSAHAFVDGAWTEVLREFFGTKKLDLTISSTTTGTSLSFSNTDDVNKAVTDARIFAGFHYRSACVRGTVLGRKVAKYIGKNYFLSNQD